MAQQLGPLHGVTVLEVGGFMAAPFATMQLADLGALVQKVENPADGDPVRAAGPFVHGESSPFARLNRNKTSVALDLKSSRGRAAFLRLVEKADVLVENLRPGAMISLRLGYDDVRAVNPRIVYASASGWGQDGELAHMPGLDIMAQARGGLMSVTGQPGGEPVKVGVPICDLVCALYVALAVTSALHERERSGVGQYIDVSLLESGVSLAIWEAGDFFATGAIAGPLGSAHQRLAPYQALRTSDGFCTVGAVTPKTWTSLCAAFGLEDLLVDPRFADASARHAHRSELIPAIEKVTAARKTTEVIDILDRAGVPCAPICDFGEVFTSPVLVDRGFFWDATHPKMGSVRQLGSPMRFSRTPTVNGQAGPILGSGTRETLLAAGYKATDLNELMVAAVAARGPESDDVPAPADQDSERPFPVI